MRIQAFETVGRSERVHKFRAMPQKKEVTYVFAPVPSALLPTSVCCRATMRASARESPFAPPHATRRRPRRLRR